MVTAEPIIDETPVLSEGYVSDTYDPVIARAVRDARAAFDAENYDRAIAACERLLTQRPETPEALMLLGLTSWKLDEPVHAVDLLRRAQSADGNTREYADALATLLAYLGESTESLYFAKLATILTPHPMGDALLPANFREYFKHLAFARPHIYRTRAREAMERGALNNAITLLEKQLDLTPRDPETLRLTFDALLETGAIARAVTVIETILEDYPTAQDHDRMAQALSRAGYHDAALERHDMAIELHPDNPAIAQSRLRTLAACHGDLPPGIAYADACRDWEQRFAASSADRAFDNTREPERRLRVGYTGAAMHATGLAPILEPVLHAHDPEAVEIYIYARGMRQDMTTQNLMRRCTRWTDLNGVDPETSAEIMRNDGIDLLVDLVGHGANSHLQTFAHAPAPIRLGWLGVIPADGGLYDARLNASSGAALPFLHPVARHDAIAAPGDGPITFGVVAPVGAIGPATFETAQAVLDVVPGSRLLVANTGHHDEETMARVHALSKDFGLDARVIVAELDSSTAPSRDFFAHIDVALDTWPAGSFTDAADALGAGVPVLTRPGGRTALALSALGRDEWIGESVPDISAMARELADREKLATLRGQLRAAASASALFDTKAFTRALEAAYRAHWRNWCAEHSPN